MTADSVTAQWGSMVAAGGHGSPQRILGAPVSSGGHGTYPLVVASPVCPPMVAPSLRAAAPLRDLRINSDSDIMHKGVCI
jgi:hypothetical protein